MIKNQPALNEQPISKPVKENTGLLDVHSIFYTIQGEGPFCGTPAVFVRLAGCNLRCPMCDTEYTLGSAHMDMQTIMSHIEIAKARGIYGPSYPLDGPVPHGGLVVITGGEPFRQNLTSLIHLLVSNRYFVQIETNGTLPPAEVAPGIYRRMGFDKRRGAYIVCSPKTGKINPELERQACCFKYVLDGEPDSDGLPITALGHRANPRLARPPKNDPRPVYLQPADHKDPDKNAANLEAVKQACLRHGYTLQLQIHKYLDME